MASKLEPYTIWPFKKFAKTIFYTHESNGKNANNAVEL